MKKINIDIWLTELAIVEFDGKINKYTFIKHFVKMAWLNQRHDGMDNSYSSVHKYLLRNNYFKNFVYRPTPKLPVNFSETLSKLPKMPEKEFKSYFYETNDPFIENGNIYQLVYKFIITIITCRYSVSGDFVFVCFSFIFHSVTDDNIYSRWFLLYTSWIPHCKLSLATQLL